MPTPLRVLVGAPPPELDLDETLALPAYRHYRLLQRIHSPATGQLSVLRCRLVLIRS